MNFLTNSEGIWALFNQYARLNTGDCVIKTTINGAAMKGWEFENQINQNLPITVPISRIFSTIEDIKFCGDFASLVDNKIKLWSLRESNLYLVNIDEQLSNIIPYEHIVSDLDAFLDKISDDYDGHRSTSLMVKIIKYSEGYSCN